MIYVNFNGIIFPPDFVTCFAQTASGCGRPQCGELFCTQPDFAFLARRATPHFERERRALGPFTQTDVTAARFGGQIALKDIRAGRTQNGHRQVLDQEFALDLARRSVMPTAHAYVTLVSAWTSAMVRRV